MRKREIEIDATKMPRELQDMLEGLIDNLEEKIKGKKKAKVEIGKLPSNLQREFMKHKLREKALEDELDMRKEQILNQLALEFVDKHAEIQEQHKNIWEQIYTHFNLDPDKSYTYNTPSNTVFRYVDNE